MSFTNSNPVVVGAAVRKGHYDAIFANTVALKEARTTHDLGGSHHDAVVDMALVDIPGAIYAEVDGSNLTGFTVEVHAMCKVASGTGYIRLYNVTTPGNVGSEVSFVSTVPSLVKITGITLAAGVTQYKLRVRGATADALPSVWGAKLVIR